MNLIRTIYKKVKSPEYYRNYYLSNGFSDVYVKTGINCYKIYGVPDKARIQWAKEITDLRKRAGFKSGRTAAKFLGLPYKTYWSFESPLHIRQGEKLTRLKTKFRERIFEKPTILVKGNVT